MKLLTLNTHSWLEIHQFEKIRILADFIVDRGIDVVALQEVNQNTVATPIISSPEAFISAGDRPLRQNNFCLLLAQMLQQRGANYTWSWVDSHEGWGIYDEGVSLLSRLPVRSVQAFEMSPQKFTYHDVFRRCALAMEIEHATGKCAWFVSAHMNWWQIQGEHLFEHDFAALDQQVREFAGENPVFLMGDFNNDAAVAGEGYTQIRALGWHDSFDLADTVEGEHTVHRSISGWESVSEAMRIDYIFCSVKIGVDRYSIVFPDHSSEAVSDHSGVLVELATGVLGNRK